MRRTLVDRALTTAGLIGLADRYWSITKQKGKLDHGAFQRLAQDLIDLDDGVVFRTPYGALFGHIAPVPLKLGRRCAVELWWFAEDNSGEALLSAFESWARERGADEIQISSTTYRAGAVKRKLRARGYEPDEFTYLKVINGI